MKTKTEMVHLNRTQAAFYDEIQRASTEKGGRGYSANKQANLATRIWATLRERQQAAVQQAGATERGGAFMREWITRKNGGRALELGCFSGSPMTFHLIDATSEYVGVELSREAVDVLNTQIDNQGFAHKARAVCGDVLEFHDAEGFDVVYAHGVLHHFENPRPLFEHLRALMKPDGMLVFSEVSAVNPWHRVARSLYRPLQADAAWEWPFTADTVASLNQHFRLVQALGWGRYTLALSVFVGVPLISAIVEPLYRKLIQRELENQSVGTVWLNSVVCGICTPRL